MKFTPPLTEGTLIKRYKPRFNVRLKDESQKVVLLNPAGTREPYYIDYGWRRAAPTSPRSPCQRATRPGRSKRARL